MSNRITVRRTIFVNAKDKEKSFGYRMYDDHGVTYSNSLTEAEMNIPDEQLLIHIQEGGDDTAQDMISFLQDDDGHGLYIDDQWYPLGIG